LKGNDTQFKLALAGAICREIGARDFYGKLSDAIKNAEGKEKFRRLSGDEENHRAKLVSWYGKLFGGSFVPDPKMLRDSELKGFAVSDRTTALEAIGIAIKAEMSAESFYAEQAQAASVPELRALFEKLAAEEHGHYVFLEAERNSITGGFYWFDIDSANFLED
jgi:rubrerythrin